MYQNESRDRVECQYVEREIVETTKALVDLYKSAFGDEWIGVFTATVNVSLGREVR
jgi:hypothetical protein